MKDFFHYLENTAVSLVHSNPESSVLLQNTKLICLTKETNYLGISS